jgi:predicted metal-dependent phosphoesterase TrpH
MPGNIDLHLHTNMSDGALTPKELLHEVRARDLVAFAVTDHDTIDGYLEMKSLLNDDDPELISGLELSVAVDSNDLHMLAYLFDPDNEELIEKLRYFRRERNHRGRRMVEKLNRLGMALSMEAVLEAAGESAIGRPHIAEAMLNEGFVNNIEDAFRKYIGNHCPAYIPKNMVHPREAIELIHRAGGLVVMAHPYINDAHKQIPSLALLGLDGVEVYYYSHSKQHVADLKRVAKQHGLLLSGGSDFHGRQEHEGDIGAGPVPVEYLDRMKNRVREIRGTL